MTKKKEKQVRKAGPPKNTVTLTITRIVSGSTVAVFIRKKNSPGELDKRRKPLFLGVADGSNLEILVPKNTLIQARINKEGYNLWQGNLKTGDGVSFAVNQSRNPPPVKKVVETKKPRPRILPPERAPDIEYDWDGSLDLPLNALPVGPKEPANIRNRRIIF